MTATSPPQAAQFLWFGLRPAASPPLGREIERKIGGELRKYYEPSTELPYSLLALLLQMNEESGEN